MQLLQQFHGWLKVDEYVMNEASLKKRISVKLILFGGAVLLLLTCVLGYMLLPDYRNALEEQREKAGVVITDRNGRILRILPDARDHLSIWYSIDSIPDIVKTCFIVSEDKRFRYHPGFDPIAIIRAVQSNIASGKTVSGASTITQQVVRLIEPRPRTIRSKIIEFICALKMEIQLSKDRILELHLNLSPMGRNIYGVGLASRTYFGKDLQSINVAEAAALAVLPRSPSRFNPRWQSGQRMLIAEKDRLLTTMAELGLLSNQSLAVMVGPAIRFVNRPTPLEAPHLVDLVMARGGRGNGNIRTTIDLDLQKSSERIVRSHKARLNRMGISQVGLMIASVNPGEILTLIGSLDYSEKDLGYNNAVLALRSAGSTLKPFLYTLSLERGMQPSEEIADTFRSYRTPHGDYLPFNADRRWYGPVSLRSALGNSLNIPAVKTIRELGIKDFYELLGSLQLCNPKIADSGEYGLGLAIGNIEVNLFRLVQAYRVFATQGLFGQLTFIAGEMHPGPSASRVFSRESSYLTTHILSDPAARLLTFGNPDYLDFKFPVALKTGTSSKYKDCWIVAYTSRHVIGLWGGNFSGAPGSGASAAALGPILKELIVHLYSAEEPEAFPRPQGLEETTICWMSGKIARPDCPYVTKDLIRTSETLGKCELNHENDRHDLASTYAHWLNRRETQQGSGRYRLMHSIHDPTDTIMGKFSSARGKGIEIVSPHNHDCFILSPHNARKVLFRAIPRPAVDYVTWLLNGTEVARTQAPYEFAWEMSRGTYTVLAVTPYKNAARIVIHVE